MRLERYCRICGNEIMEECGTDYPGKNWCKCGKVVMLYGKVTPLQKCNNCKIYNHRDNTHCWHCKNRLKETEGGKDNARDN